MKYKHGLILASLWLALVSFNAQAQLPSSIGGQPVVSLAPLVDEVARTLWTGVARRRRRLGRHC